MRDEATSQLLARISTATESCVPELDELGRRRDPSALRPLLARLRLRVSEAEDEAILRALGGVATPAAPPLLRQTARVMPELSARLEAIAGAVKQSGSPTLQWVDLAGGRLSVGPRPKLRGLGALRDAGATHLATLLSAQEGAEELGAAARAAGLAWVWLPLANGDPPALPRTPELLTALDAWGEVLAGGARIYLHCAAGIHRTGMIAYALMRRLGVAADAARLRLAELRPITASEVGEPRLAWGDRHAAR